MTYELFFGHKSYSSWSLRGWLLLKKFDLPFVEREVGLYSGQMAADMAELAPARLVPTLRTPDGIVVGESLAIAETLAERHPEKTMWPADPGARAAARWLAAEMHAGFSDLRQDCPMQLLWHYEGFSPSESVLKDLARIEELWSWARGTGETDGPWLFGAYSIADVFYAPVAARIAGFGLPVGAAAQAYVATHLADPAFEEWRLEGQKDPVEPDPYPFDLPRRPWGL